jgi:hypothetical protein
MQFAVCVYTTRRADGLRLDAHSQALVLESSPAGKSFNDPDFMTDSISPVPKNFWTALAVPRLNATSSSLTGRHPRSSEPQNLSRVRESEVCHLFAEEDFKALGITKLLIHRRL